MNAWASAECLLPRKQTQADGEEPTVEVGSGGRFWLTPVRGDVGVLDQEVVEAADEVDHLLALARRPDARGHFGDQLLVMGHALTRS